MYDEVLIEHNLHPAYKGEIEGVEPIKLVNASCGDELKIYLKVKEGRILDGRFSGNGCAIALASADLFIASIRGRKLEEVAEMAIEFKKMILGQEAKVEGLGVAKAMNCVSRMPARVKCAELAWKSVESLRGAES